MLYWHLYLLNIILLIVSKEYLFQKGMNHYYSLLCDESNICDRYNLGMPSKKKNYVDRETVPIPSYPPTIDAVSEYLDREYW